MGVMSEWKKRGVWAFLGAAVGFGASAFLQTQPVAAVATSGGTEGTIIATGMSQNTSLELLWMLDDKGMLTAFLMGAQGRTVAAPAVDVKQKLRAKGGKKGKYAMVTGRYQVQGQISDVLYVTEASSNQVAVFTLGNNGIVLVSTLSSSNQ